MSKFLLPSALVLAVHFFVLQRDASAAVITKHVHSDTAGGDFIISCDSGPITADYAAETASDVPLTDPYAVERGADRGLVHLMNQGGTPAKVYFIPHDLIRAIVSVKYDADVLDRVDLVFTTGDLMLIHTSATGGGIFTGSDVYQLPYTPVQGVDRKPVQSGQDLLQALDLERFSADRKRSARSITLFWRATLSP
jgi:hypothetical protein